MHTQTQYVYTITSQRGAKLKKRSEETQTLRAGCSKAEPKIFAPPQAFPGARDGQKLISWRWSLPLVQTQFGEDRCTQFRVIVVADPHTSTQSGRLRYTAPQTFPTAADPAKFLLLALPRSGINFAINSGIRIVI